MTSRLAKKAELLLQKQSEQESVRLLQMVGDISIWWNFIYDIILRAIHLITINLEDCLFKIEGVRLSIYPIYRIAIPLCIAIILLP
jgi:hypothetical protein